MTYIDLQNYVIHAHSTGGENMSADYFHLLSNFCVNGHEFHIHQHHNKAPLRYAGAFMLYAAQAYSKGKHEIDKHVNFEEVSQHYDSLINKKRYNKLKIERKEPTKHEDKNEGIGSRVRKFFADAVKDSTSRVIGDVVADRAFGNRKPSITRGIAKGITSGVTRGIARGIIEHASKKFDNWSKARTDHEKIQDDHKKHKRNRRNKRIKIKDTDDDYTFEQSRDMFWKGTKGIVKSAAKQIKKGAGYIAKGAATGADYAMTGAGYAAKGAGYAMKGAATGAGYAMTGAGYAAKGAAKGADYAMTGAGYAMTGAGYAAKGAGYAMKGVATGADYAMTGAGYAVKGAGYAMKGAATGTDYAMKGAGYAAKGAGYAMKGVKSRAGYALKGVKSVNDIALKSARGIVDSIYRKWQDFVKNAQKKQIKRALESDTPWYWDKLSKTEQNLIKSNDDMYNLVDNLFNKYKLKQYSKEILKLKENGESDEPWYSSSNLSKSMKGVYSKLKEYGRKAKDTIKETIELIDTT